MQVPQPLMPFIPKFETLFLGIAAQPDATFLQSGHPFGWLLTLLKRQDAETPVFIDALERLGEHLNTLTDEQRTAWKQAIYFLHLLVFHKRSTPEQHVLEQMLSEHQETFGFTQQEADLMQTLAEHYLEQGKAEGIEEGREQGREIGIEEGARQMSIENTLTILTRRFPGTDVTAVESRLEAIDDLNRVRQLTLNASIAETFHDFQEGLET